MEITGLWTARFSTSLGSGSGVLSISDGRIAGGDSNYYYSGSYRVDPVRKSVSGSLRVVHFYGPLTAVFGPVRDISLTFVGAIGEDLIIATALSATHSELQIRLERVERY